MSSTLTSAQFQLISSFEEEWGEWELLVSYGSISFHSSWVELYKEDPEGEDIPTGEVLLTGLESSSKGSGLGDSVLQVLKEWATHQGYKSIALTPGGKHLENFYLRGGWKPPIERGGHWKCEL